MHGFSGESIDAGENVLLYSSAFDAEGAAVCLDLLQSTQSSDRAVLEVAYAKSPNRRKATWHRVVGEVPEEWTFIRVENNGQDAMSRSRREHDDPTVETVAGQNMTRLGMRITEWLDRWDERDLDISMCFNSVTAFFQYTTTGLGLRFLDALTTKTSAVDAVSHYHVNPEAHDDQTREALKARFDGVVSIDGEWTEASV